MNLYLKNIRKSILIICLLLVGSAIYAQNSSKITIKRKNISLQEALAEVRKLTHMSISYNDSQLPVNRISLDIEKQPLEQALKVILKGTGFTYLIKDNYIMIVPEQNIKKAKSRNISGNVVDAKGEPLIGVTVIEKGTTNGAVTDLDGNYKITTKTATPVLVFSYVGYQTKETHATENIVNIVLEDGAQELGEVVVTALGIKRSEKALSYNVQKVGNDAVTTVKSANFMNSLSGKVAGVNINASSAGMGGAARVVMRGPKSISQSNQALYVIDGIPVTGRSQGELKGDAMMYANQPGTESIADVNPEDIESISVLSGPAAALYGSAAAQGVVMITTKKGQEGKVSVTISNSSQFANPFVMPKFQDQYVNRPEEIKTWGDKAASEFGTYEPADFFNTGTNIQNNISLTAGTSKNQTYLSVGTTNAQGIIPNNSYDRYNFTFRNTTSFLNDKMTCDFNFNYIREKDKNLMAQGQWFNPLTSLYLFPRGESFDAIRTFEVYDPVRKIYVQNWNYGDALKMQNPYWVANRMNRTNDRNRYMVSASLKYEILDWLNVTGRLRWDDAATKQEDKRYASTLKLFAPSDYGFYGYDKINDQTLYGDLMLNINKTLGENFSISSNMGASFSRLKYDVTGFQGGLKAPSNVFTPNAIDYGNATNDNRPIFESYKHYINSMFISAELGYRSMLYLTLTGRNDWDSALHGTAQTSFFYPSVGVSAVISEMAKMPQMINYLKVRASWASVGSAIEPNLSSAWRYEYNPALGTYKTVTYKFPKKFYPERTDSWEAGVTARLFGNALSVDLTVYQSNTRKQTLLRDVTSGAAGFNKEYIQTGNIRNRGLELSVGYTKSWADFTWSSSLAYSMNRNKIVELLENPNEVVRQAGLSGCGVVLKKGGGMGDIYTYTDFKRDAEGNIALDSNGNVMQTNLSNPQYRGSVLPKGNLGFSNDFSWKGVNLGFVPDCAPGRYMYVTDTGYSG